GGVLGSAVAAIFCFILILPFLWSLIARKFSQTEFTNLWSNKRYRGPLLILRLVRVVLAIIYLGIFLIGFYNIQVAIIGSILIGIFTALFYKKIHSFYVKIENRFLDNFNDREMQQLARGRHELAPWDA